jgi:16S rRNA (guanine966-N2)-methyltransferase
MKPSHPHSSPRRERPAAVRIIGGSHKRSLLPVLDAQGLRPTGDRVRETLFNWLGQDLSAWRCIDAFAGSGALGFEAASRGAREVLLVEQSGPLVASLVTTATRLKLPMVRVERGDALAALRREQAQAWDLVFLDPPFVLGDSAVVEDALRAAAQAVSPSGLCYLEAPAVWLDERLANLGWRTRKVGKAGAVHFHLLERLS